MVTQQPDKPIVVLSYTDSIDDAPCPLCETTVYGGPAFRLTLPDDRPVCERCAGEHAPAGAWEMAEGLNSIATALHFAKPKHRRGLVVTVWESIDDLANAYGLFDLDDDEAVSS